MRPASRCMPIVQRPCEPDARPAWLVGCSAAWPGAEIRSGTHIIEEVRRSSLIWMAPAAHPRRHAPHPPHAREFFTNAICTFSLYAMTVPTGQLRMHSWHPTHFRPSMTMCFLVIRCVLSGPCPIARPPLLCLRALHDAVPPLSPAPSADVQRTNPTVLAKRRRRDYANAAFPFKGTPTRTASPRFYRPNQGF